MNGAGGRRKWRQKSARKKWHNGENNEIARSESKWQRKQKKMRKKIIIAGGIESVNENEQRRNNKRRGMA